ncbi:anti-sigma factor family protein [Actinomadura terrae]|uniref:anti-sigma factor family protein n=1 Tax=Actinomadura terrae TaxID=604353 RepID=UPI001FA732A1|nr:zf-HC2 domain-containing protein [Actinomadura terrae]
MSSQVEHTDVGAYALGLLEDADRRAFETHLDECETCASELRQMSGMADALSGIGPFVDAHDDETRDDKTHDDSDGGGAGERGAEGPPARVIDLRQRRAERRFRRGTYIIGVAAAAVLLATGVTIGSALGSDDPASDLHSAHGPAKALVIWGERHQAADAGTGASGVVGLESKGWGTHVGLELKGVRGPLNCHLEAVSRTGERSVVTGWRVPAKGYGVPGSPDPLITHGGTGILRGDLSRFEVVVDGGRTLLSIPV